MNKALRSLWLALLAGTAAAAMAGPLVTETAAGSRAMPSYAADGVVEAVRSSVIGAEISGRVTVLRVQAGDRVRAGDVLLRIDERVAAQQATAAEAQLAVARAEFERKRRLYEKEYLSKAAFERAEADFKAARAQAAAAGVENGLRTITAPYTGIVAEVNVELGDMVMPGQPLLRLYDPAKLRVTAHLPQTQTGLLVQGTVHVEIVGAPRGLDQLEVKEYSVLPAADAATHTVEVRVPLPAAAQMQLLAPGMFARVLLPLRESGGDARITVPVKAVVRRSELCAVYVVDASGRAQLRQIRTGRRSGERIEVLAGLDPGEKVALDPLAAVRQGR